MTKSLCESCIHRDEAMEYSHGGASIVPICLYNHALFQRVMKIEQCKNYRNENAEAD